MGRHKPGDALEDFSQAARQFADSFRARMAAFEVQQAQEVEGASEEGHSRASHRSERAPLRAERLAAKRLSARRQLRCWYVGWAELTGFGAPVSL